MDNALTLGFSEDLEGSYNSQSQAQCNNAATPLVNEKWETQLLSEIDCFLLAPVEVQLQRVCCNSFSEVSPSNPGAPSDFSGSSPSSPLNNELLVHSTRCCDLANNLLEQIQPPDAGEGNNRSSIGDDHAIGSACRIRLPPVSAPLASCGLQELGAVP